MLNVTMLSLHLYLCVLLDYNALRSGNEMILMMASSYGGENLYVLTIHCNQNLWLARKMIHLCIFFGLREAMEKLQWMVGMGYTKHDI